MIEKCNWALRMKCGNIFNCRSVAVISFYVIISRHGQLPVSFVTPLCGAVLNN